MRSTDYYSLQCIWKNYLIFFLLLFILPPNDSVEFQINRLDIDMQLILLNESFRCKKKNQKKKEKFFRFTNRSTKKQNKTQLVQEKSKR